MSERNVGLVGATGVGVGAIVGGGIFVLAGVAYAETGPGAVFAFAINAVIAVLTALSFAELGTAFPESGGSYRFAKRVLGVQTAFGAGWVLWFAYIVGSVLYALGFAAYFLALFATALGDGAPPWLTGGFAVHVVALAVAGFSAWQLTRSATGGGQAATIGKLAVFLVLVAVGIVAMIRAEPGTVAGHLDPMLPEGMVGLISAMGFTFIAVQGFELVTAIGGDVKQPRRNIPRAMLLSLAIAMAVYLPLLIIISTVGVPEGSSVTELAIAEPDTVMATAAANFMGPLGRWLVIIAAVLSTLSALQANFLAGAATARAMANDRTLPAFLAELHVDRKTPVSAVMVTFAAIAVLILALPDLGAAGAAASLIFLTSFTLAHVTAYLARRRGSADRGGLLLPAFPVIPIVGGVACLSLAIFQAVVVPTAGAITAAWLVLGAVLYMSIFSERAEAVDAAEEAHDPALLRLRGRNPLVLVPVTNPRKAAGLVRVGHAISPPEYGRLVLFTVIPPGSGEDSSLQPLYQAHDSLYEGLAASLQRSRRADAMMTIDDDPWNAIERAVREHGCESLLLGFSHVPRDARGSRLETLMGAVDCDVCMLRAPDDWDVTKVERILVPVAGPGQDRIRARLLASLARDHERTVRYVRVVKTGTSETEVQDIARRLHRLADEEIRGGNAGVLVSDNVGEVLAAEARKYDLVILGAQRKGRRTAVFSDVILDIAETGVPVLVLSGRW